MGVAKIFDQLMGYSVVDFPKSEVELVRFRCMLEVQRARSVKDDTLSLEDRLYAFLNKLEITDFPKSLKEHMEFNGKLLNTFVNKQPAAFLA